jgi:hypothetical protein
VLVFFAEQRGQLRGIAFLHDVQGPQGPQAMHDVWFTRDDAL